MHETMKVFTEQVTTNQFLVAFFYIFATIGVLLGTISIVLIDGSMVKAKSLITTVTQKVLSAFISSMAFMVVGYAIWNLQYYQALSVPDALKAAIGDWSLWGMALTHYSQNIDTAVVAEGDTFQIFSIFFFCFAGLTAALIHGAGLERLKASASYLTSAFVGAFVVPVAAYLTYGSASFLTNMGLHDFVGAYCLYMVVGVWSVVLAWRLGPRLTIPTKPENFSMLTFGILLLLVAIPMFVVGCGFLVPGVGYFGPTMATSGLGIVFTNVFMSFGGGALAGGILAYRTGKPSYILFGPIAGYVACSALFDIVMPWQAFLLSLFGPFILKGGEMVMAVLKIDEPKVAPLALGPSIFSVLAAGIVGSGVQQGGFFGIKEGAYAFQHATVSLGPQILGIVVIVVGTGVSALIVTLLIERTLGLRVPAALEMAGLDTAVFGQTGIADPVDTVRNLAG
ncbi:ammonium transporter [Rhizobium sp. FY34]|uniref:ammonium transporter n=1 Tax=Rhizobium sp. FY34 TaxID=2562309 RepID=UPI0014857FC7|nr:ammonium transporter [Rhizobium sp. FY34]